MRFSEDTIEQVRQAVDLVELIGGHVSLRKAGQAWKGLCPFHDEKTPSFTVNPERQAYHCFGCGAGGDAFRFVMETDRLPFVEAVEALAERYGVTLPKAQEEDRAGRLHRALEEAQVFYRRTLEDPETGRAARAYLAGRGLTLQVLEDYGVGYAPDGRDELASRLTGSVGLAALLDAGLVIRREKGVGAYAEDLDPFLACQRRARIRNIGAGAVPLRDDPFALQFEVGPGHSVGINQQLLGEHADGRQFLPGGQTATGDQILDLVDDLHIDRNAVVRCNMNLHYS